MATKTADRSGIEVGLTIDSETQTVVGHPQKIDLASALDVRREMARVYRETKAGRIDTADGAKLVYMLSQVGKLIESQELEARIGALEAKQIGKRLTSPR